jgi:hypothetical protein
MTQTGSSDSVRTVERLLRLLSVRFKVNGEWVELARDAVAGFDVDGDYVDVGQSIREAFGGGIQAGTDREIELRFTWTEPPADEEEDHDDATG